MKGKKMKKTIVSIISAAICMLLLAAFGCQKDAETQTAEPSQPAEEVVDAEEYVTLGDYLGIEYTPATPAEVTDADVEDSIKSSISSYAETEEVTARPVQEGDVVNIDYVGRIDGEEFSGGSYKGWDLEIGSNSFIEGFEDGLIGAQIGQTLDVTTRFPNEYKNDPSLAGKEAIFTVTVNSITQTVYPELTDEFVKENLGYDSADEYRAAVRRNLEESAQSTASNTDKNTILNTVIENAQLKSYPQDILDEINAKYIELYENQANSYGYDSIEDYLAAYEVEMSDFEKQIESYSKSMLKSDLVFEAIAKKEGIEVTDDMLEEAKQVYISNKGYDSEAEFEKGMGMYFDEYYSQYYAPYKAYTLEYEVMIAKAQDLVIQNAKVAE